MHIYIYIYIYHSTPNLPTNIMDFSGLDSSIILIQRGETPRPIGNSPENLSKAILVGIIFVGRVGVCVYVCMCIYIYIHTCH